MNSLDLLMSELETTSERSLKLGYFHPASTEYIVKSADLTSNPKLYLKYIAAIEQVIKMPTIGMLMLIKAYVNSSSPRIISIRNYNSDINDCPILDRCPVFHLNYALKELPGQMTAPKELVVLTQHLASERGRKLYFERLRFQNIDECKPLTVEDLRSWVLLNLTNYSVYEFAHGQNELMLCVG
ncbi:hypothetical protein VIBNIFTn2_120116 [Vibrio nigripulchritudo FTn2]|uniref:hypothetical protein n=1 Tax=Vibrio nigripulchritudo TaxID=28173 RepID=UPI0003B2070D|nr:hypothetical protein [Vibrio nigripulchritudo]CCN40134.1 hypothetical protein VIBNIFTn2_120116 [Vibrio nigripulchritudo FTn2]